MSGLPGSDETFLRNRSPSLQSALRRATSHFVSLFRLLPESALVARADEDFKALKLGLLVCRGARVLCLATASQRTASQVEVRVRFRDERHACPLSADISWPRVSCADSSRHAACAGYAVSAGSGTRHRIPALQSPGR